MPDTTNPDDLVWIPVDSYEDIPDGLWVIKDDTGELQVADFRSDNPARTIGHHFAFDVPVKEYAPLILPKES